MPRPPTPHAEMPEPVRSETPPSVPAAPKPTFWQKLKGGQMRELLPRLRPHTGPIVIATVMLLIGSALGLALPWIVGGIFDGAVMRGSRLGPHRTARTLLA